MVSSIFKNVIVLFVSWTTKTKGDIFTVEQDSKDADKSQTQQSSADLTAFVSF